MFIDTEYAALNRLELLRFYTAQSDGFVFFVKSFFVIPQIKCVKLIIENSK